MTSIASHQVKCDNCKTTLGDHYPKGRKNISLGLDMGTNADGYTDYKQHDFCDENCLREHLVKRTKVAKAAETFAGSRLLQLDVTKSPNFKPITKE
jgi:hypothetical protein